MQWIPKEQRLRGRGRLPDNEGPRPHHKLLDWTCTGEDSRSQAPVPPIARPYPDDDVPPAVDQVLSSAPTVGLCVRQQASVEFHRKTQQAHAFWT